MQKHVRGGGELEEGKPSKKKAVNRAVKIHNPILEFKSRLGKVEKKIGWIEPSKMTKM